MISLTASVSRRRLLGLLFGVLVWGVAAPEARAQAPFLNLGIYGGVPGPEQHRGAVTAVRLTRLSAAKQPVQISLPLNGLLDYSFVYVPTRQLGRNAFLTGGR